MGRCYRAYNPAWSFAPLSGAGAAMVGGRFNRKGEAVLYLSLDLITSVIECTQGLINRLQPLTLCEYDVDCDGVADLRDTAVQVDHACSRDELGCAWLSCQLAGKEAPSWAITDRLEASGHNGLLVSSFAPGATGDNFVLWNWGPDRPHRVAVFDPSGRVPKNQQSWPGLGDRN